MKKMIAAFVLILAAAAVCTGCGGGSKNYKDGTYTARSSIYESLSDEEDEGGEGYGEVTITVKDNTVTACEFTTYMPDGTVKDAEYGKQNGEIANQDYYNKAQRGPGQPELCGTAGLQGKAGGCGRNHRRHDLLQ